MEDEPLQLDFFLVLLKEYYHNSKCRFFTALNFDTAEEILQENEIDLLFLDLNLHGLDGFELLKNPFVENTQTIIVSGHLEKALEAFNYPVLDFLTKPVRYSRLEQAIHKFENKKFWRKVSRTLTIKSKDKIEFVPLNEIDYLEGFNKYTKVYLKNGKVETLKKTLSDVSYILPEQFYRIHKSYILNLNEIIIVNQKTRSSIELRSGVKLPITKKSIQELILKIK